MPLFRFHAGSLQDSLKSTIIVKTLDDIRVAIINRWEKELPDGIRPPPNCNGFQIRIEKPYNDTFDPRCGWYTSYVLSNIFDEKRFILEGMLSEPLD